MKRTIQVRIFRGEQQYVAECLDLPVVTEATTLDELTANIQEALGQGPAANRGIPWFYRNDEEIVAREPTSG